MSDKYLSLRNGIYYFRARLPDILHTQLGQREIKLSLRTGDKQIARLMGSEVLLAVIPFINKALLNENIRMPDVKELLSRLAKRPSLKLITQTFDDGHSISVDMPEDRDREETVFSRRLQEYLDYRAQLEQATPPPASHAAEPPPSSRYVTQRTIRQVFKDFEQNNTDRRTQKWKSATVLDYQDTCQLYVEHIGEDKPIAHITVNEHIDFKSTLRKIPSNRSKKKAYRDYSIRELMGMEIQEKDLMSFSTINNHITRLNALTAWLRDEHKADLPVIKKLQANQDIQDQDARAVFSEDEIKQLFTHKNYANHSYKHSYYYWLIPLGLYTGCRLRELCQLETRDIRTCPDTGIAYLDFNSQLSPELKETGVVKSLKTKSSRRQIPIHSHLLELGFLEFVQTRTPPEGSRFLFDLKPSKAGDISVPASKWFQRYRKHYAFDTTAGRKDFHSLRHTFIDQLFEEEVQDVVNKDLAGHSHNGVTTRVYRKKARLERLKDGLETLDYRDAMQDVKPWDATHVD